MNKITSFISKYWNHPIALTIYSIILIYIIYRIGKNKGAVKPNTLPNDTDWGGGLTPSEGTNVRAISERLYRDMDNAWVWVGASRDCEAYQQFLGLSDTLFTAVYNDFNDLYYSKGDGTLKEWISDESFSGTRGCSGDIKDAILKRMDKLNLK